MQLILQQHWQEDTRYTLSLSLSLSAGAKRSPRFSNVFGCTLNTPQKGKRVVHLACIILVLELIVDLLKTPGRVLYDPNDKLLLLNNQVFFLKKKQQTHSVYKASI